MPRESNCGCHSVFALGNRPVLRSGGAIREETQPDSANGRNAHDDRCRFFIGPEPLASPRVPLRHSPGPVEQIATPERRMPATGDPAQVSMAAENGATIAIAGPVLPSDQSAAFRVTRTECRSIDHGWSQERRCRSLRHVPVGHAGFPFSRWTQVMKKFVLALSVLLLASSSASAWQPLAVYIPGGVQVVPSVTNQTAPAMGRLSYFKGSSVMNCRAPYTYPFQGYVPYHPVRNVVHATSAVLHRQLIRADFTKEKSAAPEPSQRACRPKSSKRADLPTRSRQAMLRRSGSTFLSDGFVGLGQRGADFSRHRRSAMAEAVELPPYSASRDRRRHSHCSFIWRLITTT